jgi:hypothetical protein
MVWFPGKPRVSASRSEDHIRHLADRIRPPCLVDKTTRMHPVVISADFRASERIKAATIRRILSTNIVVVDVGM